MTAAAAIIQPAPALALTGWVDGAVLLLAVLAFAAAGVTLAMLARVQAAVWRLKRTAHRLASGDLTARAAEDGPLRELAQSLTDMALQLGERVDAIARQRSELGAVLSSMVEGVLAVDLDERVLSLNRAAAAMLAVEPDHAVGRTIQEVVRNSALQELLSAVLREGEPRQGETTLRVAERRSDSRRFSVLSVGGDELGEDPPREVRVQAQAAPLRDAAEGRMGAVLVLHDVTRLRRLEQVRQDFVANVSHEVRTPVAAITAAVETLQHDPPEDGKDGERFLGIIARQAKRIHAILEDLLSLARLDAIERADEAGEAHLHIEMLALCPVLQAAADICRPAAHSKAIEIALECNSDLTAPVNHQLLEQAVVNLIDNAVKYSPDSTRITVGAHCANAEVAICVTDEGRGIEVEHLPRVFERFYRTDRARSRAVGGTGLGLSIVKHVAEAHGGRVSVESALGRGSTFRIHLPGESRPQMRTGQAE